MDQQQQQQQQHQQMLSPRRSSTVSPSLSCNSNDSNMGSENPNEMVSEFLSCRAFVPTSLTFRGHNRVSCKNGSGLAPPSVRHPRPRVFFRGGSPGPCWVRVPWEVRQFRSRIKQLFSSATSFGDEPRANEAGSERDVTWPRRRTLLSSTAPVWVSSEMFGKPKRTFESRTLLCKSKAFCKGPVWKRSLSVCCVAWRCVEMNHDVNKI